MVQMLLFSPVQASCSYEKYQVWSEGEHNNKAYSDNSFKDPDLVHIGNCKTELKLHLRPRYTHRRESVIQTKF